jgi:integrase
MPRKIPWPPPIYVRKGREYMRLRLGPGRYREVSLGRAGSAEARAEYARICAEVATNSMRIPGPVAHLSVSEVCRAHAAWARGYYDRRQYHRVWTALKPVWELYGSVRAVDFGPLALQTVRARYVEAGYARTFCNQLTACVRRCFRWAAGEQMVPITVAQALAAVAALRLGKTAAPERKRVRPPAIEDVEKTLSHLVPTLADMMRVLRLCGCRPGELCAVTAGDMDRNWLQVEGVPLWSALLEAHKNAWRGGERLLVFGPRAQAILSPYLDRPADQHLFRPLDGLREYCRQHGIEGHAEHWRPAPGPCYTTAAVDRAVRKACAKAGVTAWRPNQLRHLTATEVETRYGRESAQAVLGHDNPTTTSIYSERAQKAARVLAEVG